MPHGPFRRLVGRSLGIRGDRVTPGIFNDIYDALENTPTIDEVDGIVAAAIADDPTIIGIATDAAEDAAVPAVEDALAAADLITAEESTTNLLANPTFDAGTTGWTRAGALETVSHETVDTYEGAGAYKVVTTGVGNQGLGSSVNTALVSPGDEVTFSIYAKLDTATTMTFNIVERNSSHVVQVTHSEQIAVTTAWARYDISATITDPDTTQVTVTMTTQSARTLRCDNAQIEKKAYATAFVVGTRAGNPVPITQAWTDQNGAAWAMDLSTAGVVTLTKRGTSTIYTLRDDRITGATPVVTFSANFVATSISSAQTIPITDTRIRALGAFGNGTTSSGGFTYYHSNVNVGGTVSQQPTYIEFMTDAQVFELNAFGVFRGNILVDGEWVSPTMLDPGKVNGNRYWIKVTFPDTRPRHVAFVGTTDAADLRIGPLANVWLPTTSPGEKIAFVADSYGQGFGPLVPGGFAFPAALDLGFKDIRLSAIGGTGYLNANVTYRTYRGRYADDIVAWNPDYVVLVGGINDQGRQSKATLQSEVEALVDQHDASLPGVPLIATGPWSVGNTTNVASAYIDVRDAIKDGLATSTSPWAFIDTLTSNITTSTGVTITSSSPWIFGTGKTTALAGNGNADLYIGSDGTHPSTDGYRYLGMRLAAAIRATGLVP